MKLGMADSESSFLCEIAEVAELVDAHDSKSCALGRVGSIPTFGTSFIQQKTLRYG